MAQVSKYRYLLNQYPETVQKEQFRIICHISKRTARYLLQSGLVPCVQSGKKTRNYTIKMKDIVRYLERREIHPEKYKLPPGSYSGTYAVKPLLPESVTTEELRKYYIEFPGHSRHSFHERGRGINRRHGIYGRKMDQNEKAKSSFTWSGIYHPEGQSDRLYGQ